MLRLEDKVALVTGASKGIGAGIAKGLAAAGASVAVNYASDRRGAEAVVAAITASGGRAIVLQGDVSKSADVARLFVEVKAAYGALDVLVNNAAVYKLDPLEKVTEEEFHREFNTNVLGPLLMIREAAKYFGPSGGSIINIGSAASQLNPPNQLAPPMCRLERAEGTQASAAGQFVFDRIAMGWESRSNCRISVTLSCAAISPRTWSTHSADD